MTAAKSPRTWHPLALRLQCRKAWVSGEGTLAQIAQRHGVPKQTVVAWYRRERWSAARNKWIEAQRCDPVAPQMAIENPSPNGTLADAPTRVRKIQRLEAQLESLDNFLDNAKTADEWHKLSTARQRLFDRWRVLSNIPLPGSRRPQAERLTVSPFEAHNQTPEASTAPEIYSDSVERGEQE